MTLIRKAKAADEKEFHVLQMVLPRAENGFMIARAAEACGLELTTSRAIGSSAHEGGDRSSTDTSRFSRCIGVVERYKLGCRSHGRTLKEVANIVAVLKEYFPLVSTSLVEGSLHGRSVLEAFITIYCMQRKDHRKEEHGGQASQPLTLSEDPVPSFAPLKFTASHRDEIRAAFWYCMHCICVGKGVLKLEPPPVAPEQCLICIDDLTYETTVGCGGQGNHKICKSCIERMITDAVRVKRQHRFNCFAGDAKCRASYSRTQYDHIDPKTLKEIDRLDQEDQQSGRLYQPAQLPLLRL